MMAIIIILPIIVCLLWLAIFTWKYRHTYAAQKLLMVFAAVCTLLYLCHAIYFKNEGRPTYIMEGIYTFCTLAVYPLYYLYIHRLTSNKPLRAVCYTILLPAAILCMLRFAFPSSDAIVLVAKILNVMQIIIVLTMGLKRLNKFQKQVNNFFTETEDKDVSPIRMLLVCFVITSFLSITCSVIGREMFIGEAKLAIPSALFSVMLFILFLEGYVLPDIPLKTKELFSIEESEEEERKKEKSYITAIIKHKLEIAINEDKIYLQQNIKINDLSKAIGTNRTYLSSYLNNELGMSFSEFINTKRIEHSKELLLKSDDSVLLKSIGEMVGFLNESSFYRNFKKVTGTTPERWLKSQR